MLPIMLRMMIAAMEMTMHVHATVEGEELADDEFVTWEEVYH